MFTASSENLVGKHKILQTADYKSNSTIWNSYNTIRAKTQVDY